MRSEWIERLHDQARAEMRYCVQASDGNWCDQHQAFKFPREEACQVMTMAYVIAESAGEVMAELLSEDIAQSIAETRYQYGVLSASDARLAGRVVDNAVAIARRAGSAS